MASYDVERGIPGVDLAQALTRLAGAARRRELFAYTDQAARACARAGRWVTALQLENAKFEHFFVSGGVLAMLDDARYETS
jgi:hypothetical protein